MKVLSIVLLAVWLMLFGALWATWVTMSVHAFGVLTFVIGLAILVIGFVVWRRD